MGQQSAAFAATASPQGIKVTLDVALVLKGNEIIAVAYGGQGTPNQATFQQIANAAVMVATGNG